MPLYIDIHEPEEIVKILQKKRLAVEVKHIESGDYIIGDLAIERKTTTDLVNSVMNNRLWIQLDTLKRTYPQPILLIEGVIDWKDRMLSGIIITILLSWKYQIILSHNKEETALILEYLFTKYGVAKSNKGLPAVVRKCVTMKDIKLEMLQTISGIGVTKAKEILDKNKDIFTRKDYKLQLDIKGLRKESRELLEKVIE